MILRRRLLEQAARADVVLGAANAVRQHQAEPILRLRIGLGGFCQQLPRVRRIGRCACATERREVGDAARIAGLRRALEQFARLRFVARNA